MVKIEEIYKDNSANLSVGDCIYIIEPVSFVRGEEFYTNGWQYLKTEDTYLIFLKNLVCIDAVSYTHLGKHLDYDGNSTYMSYINTGAATWNAYKSGVCLLYTSRCV